MIFVIGGKPFDIDPADVERVATGPSPGYPDSRHKYFVGIDGRRFPVKQLLSLVTGLASAQFTAQYAVRILTKLGFVVQEFEPIVQRRISDSVNRCAVAQKLVAIDTSARTFAVTLEPDEDGYIVASCPQLLGCHSQGRSRQEAVNNIEEAIRGYIASMQNHGEAIPDVDWEVVRVTI